MKKCRHCGKEFHAKGKHIFCDDCKVVTFQCENCKQWATVERIRYEVLSVVPDERKHFCSRKCSLEYGSHIAGQERMNGCFVACPNCGKSNYRSEADSKRIFCNQKCYSEYRVKHPEIYYPHQCYTKNARDKAMQTRKENGTNWSLGKRGPLCIHWKGGKVYYRGPSWPEQKELCKIRDGMMCVVCGARGEQVHHIINFRKFGYKPEENRNDIIANHIDNLIHVCNKCHGAAKHNNRGIPRNRIKKAKQYLESIKHLLAVP